MAATGFTEPARGRPTVGFDANGAATREDIIVAAIVLISACDCFKYLKRVSGAILEC